MVWAVNMNNKNILTVLKDMALAKEMEETRDALMTRFVQNSNEVMPQTFPIARLTFSNPSLASLVWLRTTVPAVRHARYFLGRPWAV